MLPAFARRPLLARAINAARTSSFSTSSLSRHSPLTVKLTSLLSPTFLSPYRRFANVARSPSSAATLTTDFPPASPAAATNETTLPPTSSANNSTPSAGARRKRGPILKPEQQKAAENRAKQLIRAKQRERARREREKAVSSQLKEQYRRIITREKARERAALAKQRRQALKDQLRAKAAREKQLRAEERAVAQQYRALQSTRPKRPVSPFIAYANSVRSTLPAAEVSARPKETTKMLATQWHALTSEEKRKWEVGYRAAVPAYKQKLQQWNEQQLARRPPVRPLSAYTRYAQRRYNEIRAAEGGGNIASDLMKRVAAEWKELSNEDKERLRQQVAADLTGYTERMQQWEKRPANELAMWRLQRSIQKNKRQRRKAKIASTKQRAAQGTTAAAQ